MSDDVAPRSGKLPTLGERFSPREVFRGIGIFIPEMVAACKGLTMTAKACYGHLVRRAGKKSHCWPSYRDIATSIGVGERQVMRALKELADFELIHLTPRKDATGRQTSNKYEFIWGPLLQGEGDRYDILPGVTADRAGVTDPTPTRVTDMTPLEVTKKNHHQGSVKERSSARAESTIQGYSEPELGRSPSQRSKTDDDSPPREYASAKDELKALYQASRGEPIRIVDLDAIESTLSCSGVTWEAFVAEARRHDWNRLTNPTGFLKKLARTFRAKIQEASAPVTAAEAAEKDYRCQKCGSTVRGEGAQLIEGKVVPCSCASPEYVDRLRARQVLNEEPPQ